MDVLYRLGTRAECLCNPRCAKHICIGGQTLEWTNTLASKASAHLTFVLNKALKAIKKLIHFDINQLEISAADFHEI